MSKNSKTIHNSFLMPFLIKRIFPNKIIIFCLLWLHVYSISERHANIQKYITFYIHNESLKVTGKKKE